MSKWFRFKQSGIKSGAVILADSVIKFTFGEPSEDVAYLHIAEAIGFVTKHPHGGGYNSESIDSRVNIYCNDKTLDGSVEKFRAEIAERETYNSRMGEPEFALEETLKRHDWYHAYSDDHRYWASGEASLRKIRELMKQIPEQRAKELWNQYAPQDMVA